MSSSRREFLAGLASASALAAMPLAAHAGPSTCPFRLSVINDEISPDFDHACSVAANDFGLQWIELRSMWKKNITDLTDEEVDKSKEILAKYKLRVTDIASPLFKVNWPGAPPKRVHRAINSTPMPTSSTRTRYSTAALSSARHFKPIAFAASISGVSKTRNPIGRPSTTSCAQQPKSAQSTA